ncbi:nucleoside diphosphate kinase homolog 5 isoform X2 [Gouania willdenowi]|uniref:nucleoside diphosphate kinase homolog 5 isoform X2 n=1 Tax=Gouania willdenowi TaxID=441366 RepID=UPI0010542483|nr:nucleoside diphosphate kinase homolog 5 isoform X2 [Gouania willdenowi]
METQLMERISVERTLAIIKPDAVHKAEEIEDVILKSGFTVLQKRKLKLNPEQCCDFYAHQYGKDFFPNLTLYMSSGPIIVFSLARDNAIAHWKSIIGPANITKARETHPECLRAKYGTSGLKNAVHGTVMEPFPSEEANEEYLNKYVKPTLLPGLTELCKEKPLNPCIWLAEWLLKNDPNNPKICEESS